MKIVLIFSSRDSSFIDRMTRCGHCVKALCLEELPSASSAEDELEWADAVYFDTGNEGALPVLKLASALGKMIFPKNEEQRQEAQNLRHAATEEDYRNLELMAANA